MEHIGPQDGILETRYCPCQIGRFDVPDHDVVWVADDIVEVESRRWYEQKQRKAREDQSLSRTKPSAPKIPVTYRGTEITDHTFPDADFVCPLCEKEFVKEITIREQEAHERLLKEQEQEEIEQALMEDPEACRYL